MNCEVCGGESYELGAMGNLRWFRCSACGADTSETVKTEVSMTVETVTARATFPVPPRYRSKLTSSGKVLYRSVLCDSQSKAERLATNYLAKHPSLEVVCWYPKGRSAS